MVGPQPAYSPETGTLYWWRIEPGSQGLGFYTGSYRFGISGYLRHRSSQPRIDHSV